MGVSISMKMNQKQAGALYMKAIDLEDKLKLMEQKYITAVAYMDKATIDNLNLRNEAYGAIDDCEK
tara:strand:- start:12253 stop:12450 length:198 start_codon:yes stop_codon:yes gene_type:complete